MSCVDHLTYVVDAGTGIWLESSIPAIRDSILAWSSGFESKFTAPPSLAAVATRRERLGYSPTMALIAERMI